MKTFLKAVLCATAGVLFISTRLHAQNEHARKSMLTVHTGPSWYVGNLMGITNFSDSYRNDVRKGIAWDIAYWYPGKAPFETGTRVAPGLLYQGSVYKNSHDDGSDKILEHYLAPQCGLFFIRNRYQLNVACGIGWLFNHNKSIVYDHPRKISMNRLAGNLSCGGEYFLAKQWGLSAQLNYIFSSSESYTVDYHDKYWAVMHPKTGYGYFGQLSLLFGLNYHF